MAVDAIQGDSPIVRVVLYLAWNYNLERFERPDTGAPRPPSLHGESSWHVLSERLLAKVFLW